MACFDDHLRWSVWPVILIVMSLTSVESELGVTISTLYRRLLQEIGRGTLRSGSEIYYPLAVRELYQPFFDDAGLVHLEKMTNLKILSLVRTEVSMGAYRKLRKSLPKCWVNFP